MALHSSESVGVAEVDYGRSLCSFSSLSVYHSPAPQPPKVLARSRYHRTRSGVENAARPPVADQKSCEMLLDVVPQLRALSRRVGDSSG
jgi:hypothetical protein